MPVLASCIENIPNSTVILQKVQEKSRLHKWYSDQVDLNNCSEGNVMVALVQITTLP